MSINLIILTLTKKKKLRKLEYTDPTFIFKQVVLLLKIRPKKKPNVKLTEKLDFVKQNYSSDISKYDFKSIYRDINMI